MELNKKSMASFVEEVQTHLCSYGSHQFCDCKYGADNIGQGRERGCGCPEMHEVGAILEFMTDKEFDRILKRIEKEKGKWPPDLQELLH